MTVSYWRRHADKPTKIEADLCVIGAGVAGVSAALEGEARGLKVVLLERHALASGASSRNAGFLMRGCADHYADAIRVYGHERARSLWAWTEDNLRLLRTLGIESLASYRRVPSALLALNAAQEAELHESSVLLARDGFRVGWKTAAEVPESQRDLAWAGGRIRAALYNPEDASVNPVELMRMLARGLKSPIHDHQEVFGIDASSDRAVEVLTGNMRVQAARVLVCTNAYAGLLSAELGRLVTPRRGQMMALSIPGARLDASYYANHGSEYFRQTSEGQVVLGGCRTYFAEHETGYEDRTTERVQSALERFAGEVLGLDKRRDWTITARWSGTMGFSPDGLPLVGPVRDLDARGRVHFCGGFTGHGMSLGAKTARHAVERMLEGGESLFGMERVGSER